MEDNDKALVLRGYRSIPSTETEDWATAAWMKQQLPCLEEFEKQHQLQVRSVQWAFVFTHRLT
jgi:hypothetical protein